MGLFDRFKSFTAGQQPQFPTPSTPLQQPAKKVLIVDDEEVLRTTYSDILRAERFEVVAVENGALGLNELITFKPDLVLLDLLMPVMDGKTMLRSLRALPQYKTLPVVILSDTGDSDSIRETKLYYNASEFLIKGNVTPQDIVNTVKTYI